VDYDDIQRGLRAVLSLTLAWLLSYVDALSVSAADDNSVVILLPLPVGPVTVDVQLPSVVVADVIDAMPRCAGLPLLSTDD